jgi:D-alanyl-D-alanine dipeptidase
VVVDVSVIGRVAHGARRMATKRRRYRSDHAPIAIRDSLFAALAVAFAATSSLSAAAQERPASFVDAAAIVPGLMSEMRYAGAHNFVGRPIDGYRGPRCLLTREAAAALADVARELAPRGLVIKAFDCYRPVRAVADFERWARDYADTAAKAEFYPDVDKSTLFRDGYIAARSGHSRGSTIDLTLARADGRELDMGTPFDFFSPRSWAAAADISGEAKENRALLSAAMRRHGFRPYDKEWWHFTLAHEPFPATYFDFPVR